jgi:hypothetical protein
MLAVLHQLLVLSSFISQSIHTGLHMGSGQSELHMSSGLCWPLRRPCTPLATLAQAALAPHRTTDQEKSADTAFMVM